MTSKIRQGRTEKELTTQKTNLQDKYKEEENHKPNYKKKVQRKEGDKLRTRKNLIKQRRNPIPLNVTKTQESKFSEWTLIDRFRRIEAEKMTKEKRKELNYMLTRNTEG